MADSTALLLLGGVAVFGVLWFTGALCQADIANGALCPPGSGVYQPGTNQGARHWATRGAPGDSGRQRRGTLSQQQGYSDDGYGDDSGYGYSDSGDYSSYAAHISIA